MVLGTHSYFPKLFQQSLMKSFLFNIANDTDSLSVRVFVRDRQRHATDIHACFLHGIGVVGKRIVVAFLSTHFKRLAGIILYNQPGFCIHKGQDTSFRKFKKMGCAIRISNDRSFISADASAIGVI